MAINRFRRNFSRQSTFTCRVCSRKTRDTGDNGSLELCPQCYELAGIENTISDNGIDYAAEQGYIAEAEQHLAKLAKKGVDTDATWGDIKHSIADWRKSGPANDRHGEQ